MSAAVQAETPPVETPPVETPPSGAADSNTNTEKSPERQSLYERLGGTYGISGAVDLLVDRLFANAAVNANEAVRAHHGNPANAPGYKFLVTAWSIEAAGGPKCYPGLDMLAAHNHLHIDTAGFNAVYDEIAATLTSLDVPAGELAEFMALIEAYRPDVVEVIAA